MGQPDAGTPLASSNGNKNFSSFTWWHSSEKCVKKGADIPEDGRHLLCAAGIQPIGDDRHRRNNLLNRLMLLFEHVSGLRCRHVSPLF